MCVVTGRCYEGFSEQPEIVGKYAAQMVKGIQVSANPEPDATESSADNKHARATVQCSWQANDKSWRQLSTGLAMEALQEVR